VAVLYAREGARVALGYLPEEQDDADVTRAAVDDEAAAGGACLLLPGDLRHPSACRDAVARTVQHYGRLDILVNNAATQRYHPTLQTITEDDLRATFEARVHCVCVRVRESENERERERCRAHWQARLLPNGHRRQDPSGVQARAPAQGSACMCMLSLVGVVHMGVPVADKRL
jgi:NAD(P)-dependent dehydrogenase (short-subunit alcohol dehydrogenase family)